MNLDSIDIRLVTLAQAEFPLVEEPYTSLGLRLGVDADGVLSRLSALKKSGILRQIGPVVDARSLGYQSTLVAMRIDPAHLEEAEQVIAAHAAVSHGYEREHYFNVWFTFAAPPKSDMQAELVGLTSSIETEAVISLPATKLFKIGTHFDLAGENEKAASTAQTSVLPQQVDLSPVDRLVINGLQQDLPLTYRPFDGMASTVNMKICDFLAQARSLVERGVLRRYGAAVNHRQAGFKANAMTCWVAPPEAVDAAGKSLASLREVSHCYERQTGPLWRHNLFAMIHCRTREACRELADRVSRETGLNERVMLFSTREFKKARIRYAV